MTWPGAAVVIDDGFLVPPTSRPDPGAFIDALTWYDGTATIEAGDDLLLSFSPRFDSDFEDADPDSVASLAIEATSGLAQVRVSVGWDATWDGDDPAEASTLAGTYDLSAGILDIPLSVFDIAQFLTWDERLIVRVEVLSGTAEVQQVRLRVWPATGPRGAWVTIPAQSGEAAAPLRTAAISPSYDTGYDTFGTTSGAWDWAAAQLVSALPGASVTGIGTTPATTFGAVGTVSVNLASLPATFGGSWTRSLTALAALLNVSSAGESLMWESAMIRPPDVTEERLYFTTGGTVQASGLRLVGAIQTSGTHDPNSEPTYLQWSLRDIDDVVGAGYPSTVGPAFVPTGDTEPPISFDLNLSIGAVTGDGKAVLLGAGNVFFSSPGDYDGPSFLSGVEEHHRGVGQSITFTSATTQLSLPAFQVWDPDALPVEVDYPPLRIRQRGDGLGMGGPRVRGVGSRQRSPRVRGYV